VSEFFLGGIDVNVDVDVVLVTSVVVGAEVKIEMEIEIRVSCEVLPHWVIIDDRWLVDNHTYKWGYKTIGNN